jgi:hypothetical protein
MIPYLFYIPNTYINHNGNAQIILFSFNLVKIQFACRKYAFESFLINVTEMYEIYGLVLSEISKP